MIKMILAMTKQKLIGKNNGLPWKIPDELIFFQNQTINHTLLFGSKTFQNISKKLVKRKIFVLGQTNNLYNNYEILHNEQELKLLLEKYKNNSKEHLFICGGKETYESLYHFVEEIIVSVIENFYYGDVYLDLDIFNCKNKIQIIYKHPLFVSYLIKK